MHNVKELIELLYVKHFGKAPQHIIALPPSGSYRKYYRLTENNQSVIGVFNNDLKENTAFISFTKTFLEIKLKVPKLIAEDINNSVYLLSDLGDATLLSFLPGSEYDTLPDKTLTFYKKAVEQLALFQVKGGQSVDYSKCYPRQAFDKQSMMWDLNYFKYYFLKLAQIQFDEQNLENDFQTFSDYLLQADGSHFLYRDFQSRNIMIVDNEPYFIDYQGGRKGALQYDIASLLFESKTHLNAETRDILLQHYLNSLSNQIKFNKNEFLDFYYGFVYIRLMQAMGTYGFRGLYEKKELFLQSIPGAIEHLQWLRTNIKLPVKLKELEKVWDGLIQSTFIKSFAEKLMRLNVTIHSFAFKNGIPQDNSATGGGFVFDCRALNNPGRLEQYQKYTGLDEPVIDFLKDDPKVLNFLENIYSIIDLSIENYTERKFNSLMISFGCTGGQHRSVYSAEKLSEHIKQKYPKVKVDIIHRELPLKK